MLLQDQLTIILDQYDSIKNERLIQRMYALERRIKQLETELAILQAKEKYHETV